MFKKQFHLTLFLIIVMILLQFMEAESTFAANIQKPKKSFLRALPSTALRRKRDIDSSKPNEDYYYYDENYDILPINNGDRPKNLGDHISERAKEFAESFQAMWQSVTESVKRCVDSIRELFAEDREHELTPEQEEELYRAAMDAERRAIKQFKDNEIMREEN